MMAKLCRKRSPARLMTIIQSERTHWLINYSYAILVATANTPGRWGAWEHAFQVTACDVNQGDTYEFARDYDLPNPTWPPRVCVIVPGGFICTAQTTQNHDRASSRGHERSVWRSWYGQPASSEGLTVRFTRNTATARVAKMGATDRTVTSGTVSSGGRPTEHPQMLKSRETSRRRRKVLNVIVSSPRSKVKMIARFGAWLFRC